MTYVFPPVEQVGVPVHGTDLLFPVHRVYCVGRNYADHAKEVGHDISTAPPLFFCKPPASVLPVKPGDVGLFRYPEETQHVDFEVEMVVALGRDGHNVDAADANSLVFGYAVGLDLTRRDIHKKSMAGGKPWDFSKGFAGASPVGAIRPISETGVLERSPIWLDLNGERTQDSDIEMMLWKVPAMIAHLSRFFDLRAGDLLYTGTPKGVGSLKRGDLLHGEVGGVSALSIKVE